MKIKYKRDKLGDVYVSYLASNALRALGLHLVSNDIVRELHILSVFYYRWPTSVYTLISEIA